MHLNHYRNRRQVGIHAFLASAIVQIASLALSIRCISVIFCPGWEGRSNTGKRKQIGKSS